MVYKCTASMPPSAYLIILKKKRISIILHSFFFRKVSNFLVIQVKKNSQKKLSHFSNFSLRNFRPDNFVDQSFTSALVFVLQS